MLTLVLYIKVFYKEKKVTAHSGNSYLIFVFKYSRFINSLFRAMCCILFIIVKTDVLPFMSYSVIIMVYFSGPFAELRKVTISFVMSVCLSVHPQGTTLFPVVRFS